MWIIKLIKRWKSRQKWCIEKNIIKTKSSNKAIRQSWWCVGNYHLRNMYGGKRNHKLGYELARNQRNYKILSKSLFFVFLLFLIFVVIKSNSKTWMVKIMYSKISLRHQHWDNSKTGGLRIWRLKQTMWGYQGRLVRHY